MGGDKIEVMQPLLSGGLSAQESAYFAIALDDAWAATRHLSCIGKLCEVCRRRRQRSCRCSLLRDPVSRPVIASSSSYRTHLHASIMQSFIPELVNNSWPRARYNQRLHALRTQGSVRERENPKSLSVLPFNRKFHIP